MIDNMSHGNMYHDTRGQSLNIPISLPFQRLWGVYLGRVHFSNISYGISVILFIIGIFCLVEIIWGHSPDPTWVPDLFLGSGIFFFIGRTEQRFKSIEKNTDKIENRLEKIEDKI